MSHLEAVRAAIIKAVPEIVELKFGCQIQRFENTVDTLVKIESFADGKHVAHLVKADGDPLSYGPRTIDIENWKIIGRSIRLADVLVAAERMIEVSSHGGGAIYHYPNGDHNPRKTSGVQWDLKADDLSRQSEECVNFLHSLICV